VIIAAEVAEAAELPGATERVTASKCSINGAVACSGRDCAVTSTLFTFGLLPHS